MTLCLAWNPEEYYLPWSGHNPNRFPGQEERGNRDLIQTLKPVPNEKIPGANDGLNYTRRSWRVTALAGEGHKLDRGGVWGWQNRAYETTREPGRDVSQIPIPLHEHERPTPTRHYHENGGKHAWKFFNYFRFRILLREWVADNGSRNVIYGLWK